MKLLSKEALWVRRWRVRYFGMLFFSSLGGDSGFGIAGCAVSKDIRSAKNSRTCGPRPESSSAESMMISFLGERHWRRWLSYIVSITSSPANGLELSIVLTCVDSPIVLDSSGSRRYCPARFAQGVTGRRLHTRAYSWCRK